ncbi:tryptophan synthase subunit alpha [Cellvibrio japonicus]|uniref:Tryptophan synthase alpha chain n=1 Tax=Cellvibrio japonicus (strain Ueda107) TaxID=498211 RepID=B3PFP0_CELJU|nr:tryptophan synthase subunit alpha [Cellvibrio japonicus]ACE85029.1 tryptophan synthase, alpha subunit [Cellvibrio japonicus Ueda107]QEI12265.1 tryptophan synthase subunit alpha [Cellvibrio japonicus]QEI15839.1 tryptophan synthase subunit alpha [Cellvibrio japonicus]QEI19417.1 tryptophan synthase subunit alpha [Cellvibrio japonicus]
MSRISQQLTHANAAGKKVLVAYIVNGDPYPEATLPAMHALVANGVDVIELGVPFSDPMAEGPVIQRGHERALAHHISLTSTLDIVRQFRQTNGTTPVVLMGYANPVERFGYQAFARAAAEAGVDGLLTVDLPPEEVGVLKQALDEVNLDNIFLLAPTTTVERAHKIASHASGFLYYVSLKGVTGAGHLDVEAVKAKLAEFGRLTDLPVCVGFGIKDASTAKAVAQLADGVVVGSVLVDKMGAMADQPAAQIADSLGDLLSEMRQALDSL